MLNKIPKNLSPELVKILMEMGHGDEIVVADGNYPAASNAKNLVRCDGLDATNILESILELMPLDTNVDFPCILMSVPKNESKPEIWKEFEKIFKDHDINETALTAISREAFYQRGKQAYCIVATGEKRIFANVILRKGVIK